MKTISLATKSADEGQGIPSVRPGVSPVVTEYRDRLRDATALSRREDGRVSLIITPEVWKRGLIVIDPGVHGGYAFTGNDGEFYVQPFSKGGAEVAYDLLKKLSIEGSIVVIESVGASGGMAPTSAFSMGENVGQWFMILYALGIRPVFPILPAVWQKSIPGVHGKVGRDRKKKLLDFAVKAYHLGDYKPDLDTCDALLMFAWTVQFWYSFVSPGIFNPELDDTTSNEKTLDNDLGDRTTPEGVSGVGGVLKTPHRSIHNPSLSL